MFPEYEGVVLDTNIFYGLADERIKIEQLRGEFGNLFLSPVSVTEIASKINERNFEYQKKVLAACRVVNGILPHPIDYKIMAWGFSDFILDKFENQMAIVDKICGTTDIAEIKEAVEAENELRKNAQQFFLDDIENYKSESIKGYKEARERGEWVQPSDEVIEKAKKFLLEEDMMREELLALFKTSLVEYNRKTGKNLEIGTDSLEKDRVELAFSRLRYYLLMGVGLFCFRFKSAPDFNDLADRELMVYLSDKCKLVTSETVWPRIAAEVRLEKLVKKI